MDDPVGLSAGDVERFWRDGAICVRGAFSEWLALMRDAIEDVLLAPGPLAQDPARSDYGVAGHERARSFHIELGLWVRHPQFRAFAFESAALELASRLLGQDSVNLFFDQLFVKEPQSSEQRTPWHQDQAYWPISGDQVVSVWVPFDPVSQDTLHGAPGNASRTTRRRAHSIRFTGDDVRWDPRPGILERIPLMTTLPITLERGDRLTGDAFPILRSRRRD